MSSKKSPIHPLYQYRVFRDLTQEHIAKSIGVSRAHISGIERGTHVPSKKLAQAIEQATIGVVKAEDILLFHDHYSEENSKPK
ncbi:helix-turn-helix transcriptional regulator [Desulfurispirillum indicum]|uniref:Helix-turn-helix domain protein n=1 Tax=Desulfurispirillum indicum (strain ATCC BAA-1389 / DSM 22839 / S5) TaxID=653733 RepID=E6W5K5_DESIS|nr:helix-turn-helix transcriptional regulator [Desulfurispirillum indicum]ADU66036.1 helix-turn-helix domain protein [Desulfurispirillum indicum S5]UCZ57974.1 helix-turn-helix transcriptional regulator [Desulfurispirillum indicum]